MLCRVETLHCAGTRFGTLSCAMSPNRVKQLLFADLGISQTLVIIAIVSVKMPMGENLDVKS